LDALHQAFPDDKFIAEEDSSFLKSDAAVRSAVLDALSSATGSQWSEQRLYNAVDLGAFEGKASRVWVLDPVDGTTGFIRGLHYCIALALLVDGKPQASFMGCPNVNLARVLAPDVVASKGQQVADIDDSLDVDTARVHPVSAGSIFYAVSGRGAWARTLGMPLGAGFEVTVSGVEDSSQAALCEAMEASHGSRDVTEGIAKRLGLTREYLRLHGQCKYCVVGAGAAEGNLRLPGPGYREKIWDHAPGAHFITEAGGLVTDLEGRQLDFSEGRLLSANVAGILAANTALHSKILAAISEERKIKERKGQ
jgi:3'(2'), 5'-bisphosphate nucleotidase